MHSTSLIGQALGGAQGTKASPAQDSSKSSSDAAKERSFADHVEDARKKPEAEAPRSADGAQSQSNNTSQSPADSTSEGQAGGLTFESADSAADSAADSTDQQAAADGGELAAEAANAPIQAHAALNSATSQTRGEMVGQIHQHAPKSVTSHATQPGEAEGEAEMAKGGPVPTPAVDEGNAAATKTTLSGQAVPADAAAKVGIKVGIEDKKATLAAQTESDGQLDADDTKTAARSAQAESSATGVARSEPGAAAAASRAASPEAAALQAKAQAGEGKTANPSSERAAEGREQSVGASPGAAPASGNTTAASAPQSVFQMQVETAEAGEKRQARYRTREGEVQVAPAVSKASAAAAGVTAPNAAMASANAALSLAQTLQADMAKGSQSASLLADSLTSHSSLSAELPGLSQLLTEAVFQPGATHRVETPRMIAAQLAEAFAAKGERNMEVSLNPEELGRVKMRVSTSETGIVMTIQTERPETGDLMRRHINELAEEFRRMGFQDISFEFSSGDSSFGGQAEQGLTGGSGASVGGAGTDSEMAIAEQAADTPMQDLRLGSTGVDMRV